MQIDELVKNLMRYIYYIGSVALFNILSSALNKLNENSHCQLTKIHDLLDNELEPKQLGNYSLNESTVDNLLNLARKLPSNSSTLNIITTLQDIKINLISAQLI